MNIIFVGNCIAYIFLALGKPTTLMLESPLEFISLASEDAIEVSVSQNKKIVVLKPLKKLDDIPISLVTGKGNFQLRARYETGEYTQLASLSQGKKDASFSKVYESSQFRVLEGESSLKIENKSKNNLRVNSISSKSDQMACKGSPLYVGNRRVTW